MPTQYQKLLFSASDHGRPIEIGTDSAGQLIHTAPTLSEGLDEVAVLAFNTTTDPIGLHLQWGGVDAAQQLIVEAPPQQAFIAAPSLLLADNLSLRAFASADGINIQGYVNRIISTPGGGVSKALLSASISSRPIVISQTASPGDLIHTATGVSNGLDEIWIYAYNPNNSAAVITIEWGGNGASDLLVYKVDPFSPYRINPGMLLRNGLEIRCFSDPPNVSITGFVNRIQS
ncbi:MAG: hypothetical protein QNJ46_15485 [Leptolyngbyaceae cyanobacterium MO_188.B28]|nr:hypothetical protein [Leptolyngbyaceae cyanobacterium MO_188.B28]